MDRMKPNSVRYLLGGRNEAKEHQDISSTGGIKLSDIKISVR